MQRMSGLILVVEDEAHVRELVSYTLQGAGYRVRAVDDGRSALEAAAHSPPDMVVLDIRLPDIDGWEVCRRLRAASDVPILIVTALVEDESLVKGLHLGADDYMAKPFSPIVLAARVQALLRRAAPPTALAARAVRGGRDRSVAPRRRHQWFLPAAERSVSPTADARLIPGRSDWAKSSNACRVE